MEIWDLELGYPALKAGDGAILGEGNGRNLPSAPQILPLQPAQQNPLDVPIWVHVEGPKDI